MVEARLRRVQGAWPVTQRGYARAGGGAILAGRRADIEELVADDRR